MLYSPGLFPQLFMEFCPFSLSLPLLLQEFPPLSWSWNPIAGKRIHFSLQPLRISDSALAKEVFHLAFMLPFNQALLMRHECSHCLDL